MKEFVLVTDEKRFRTEIFDNACYNVPELDDSVDLTVVDIGSHVGTYVEYILPKASKIYAIEPATVNFNRLYEKYKDNDKVRMLDVGISGDGNNILLYSLGTDGGLSSIYNSGEPLQSVKTLTFGDLVKLHDIKHIDILKIDCEGMEREIFSSPSFKEYCHMIDYIVGEVHLLELNGLKYTMNVSWYLNNLGFSYEEKNGVFKCKRAK